MSHLKTTSAYENVREADQRQLAQAEKEKEKKKAASEQSKRHTPDQEALHDLAERGEKTGVSNQDADTLLEWGNEYNMPARDDRGKPHWKEGGGADHIHVGGVDHIPLK